MSVETLSTSSKFVDLDGDGYQHRTAWAGTGTGVLVIDADADGKISRSNEFVFTEWDSSATSDLEALKHIFDTNGNGKLDAGDAQWSKFRVDVNGQLVTLDSLGITSIDLTPKGSGQTFEDGSAISGTTTFTRADGTTGAVGDAILASDDAAYIVKTTSTTKADSSVEKTILAYNADGGLAFRNVVTTSADGRNVQTQFDDDGNGTFDRSQTNVLTIDASGVQTKTVSNFNADGSLSDRTTTVTSADHLTVTTTLDQDGDGIDDQKQTFIKSADGSTTTTTQQLSVNGTLLFGTAVNGSADGLVKTTSLDRDGNGVYDDIVTETTTIAADGSRTKTVIDRGSNNTVLSTSYTSTSADNRTISVTTDADGNGLAETRTINISTVVASGDVTLQTSIYNTDAASTLRSRATTVTTANGLSKTVTSDLNGDGIIDLTNSDITEIAANGDRTQTLKQISTNNTLLSQTVTTTSADGKSITIAEDANGDSKNDRLTTILIGTDGKTTNTVSILNTDGSLVSKTVTLTSADGLSKTISADANGDGSNDLVLTDVITTEVNGSRTETVTSKNANGTLIGQTVANTSADSLSQTVKTDVDGDGVFDETTTDTIVLGADGTRTETINSKSANGTLNAQSITVVSADRRTTTVTVDADGDGNLDTRQVKVIAADGSTTTTETDYAPNGTVVGTSTITVNGNGLTTTASVDLNRDSVADRITSDQTVHNADGSNTQTISLKSSNATLLDKKTIVTSGNDMSITTSEDINGDEVVDAKTTDVTTFDTYGLQFQTVSDYRGATLVGTTKVTTNLNGLSGSTDYDLDGDGTLNQTLSWKKTPLDPSGAVTTTQTVKASDASLISQRITTVSADQKTTTVSTKIDADAVVDLLETITIDNAGMQKDEVKQYKASGVLESQAVVTISDDGLSKTLSSDLDGNGVFELVTSDVTTLNADGSRTETISRKGIGDVLISRTTANVSASGFSKTTSWADASGTTARSMSDVTVLNADGSTTEALSYFKAGGALESKTVTAVAAHQLSTTVTIDVDGDNNVDKKSVITKQADGSTLQMLSDFGANAVLKDTKTVTTSADGLTQTIEYDSDGNATVDKKTTSTMVLNANGSRTTTTKDIVGSVTKSITVADVSGDGLTVSTKWDTAGTGNGTTFDKSRTDVTVLNADGSRTQTVSNFTGTTLTSRTLVTSSANGLSVTTQIDPTGAGSYSQTATDVTVLNANGTKTRTVESKKADGSLISRTITTISANGLIVASSQERPGFTNQTVTNTTTVLAGGATREIVETRDSGGALIGKIVTLTSADKLTVTIDRDGIGDGIVDQRQETVTANSGIQTLVTTNFKADGTVKDKSTVVVSADERLTTTTWDLDGNGTIDRQRVTSLTANADGSSTTVLSDTNVPGGTLAAKTTIQTSADGRLRTTSKDINGDGTVDQVETVTIDPTGASVSVVTNNATAQKVSNLTPGGVYWSQAIAAKIETTTSADGRTKIAKCDYDGNGVYETVMQSTIQVDGSIVTAVTETNASGTVTAKGTIATSADGLITSLSKDAGNNGTIDHTETAVTHADGSIMLTKVDLNGSGAMTQTVIDVVSAFGSLASSFTKDSSGRVTSQTNYNADGTREYYTYDAANKEFWSSIRQNYIASGQQSSQYQYNDDGSQVISDYDLTNGVSWSRRDIFLDAAGRQTAQTNYNDDGTREEYYLDPANSQSWTSIRKNYVAGGQQSSEYQYNDDGSKVYIDYDLTNIVSWSRRDIFLDGAGRQTGQYNYNDNGTIEKYFYDASSSQSWSTIRQNFQTASQMLNQIVYWDDKTYTNYVYNPSNGSLVSVTHYDQGGHVISPVLLDLDGDDHVDLRPIDVANIAASATFDWDGDGVRDTTAWVGPSDGFLAIDLATDGNTGSDGRIDQAKELAFSLWADPTADGETVSDLEGLRLVFDTNHDNVLDVNDDRWTEFRVWRDIDQNGISNAGELQTMTDAGIRLINLMPSSDGAQAFADGSVITGTSSYQTVDGNQHLVADARLALTPNRPANVA
ncbi:beta strand repeat-containing protein [Rhizobium leguminosarum]